ncbi:hypothetical protein Bca52824_019598 [Brassica carinata]|uniref:Uncharacterized protein n=1 Tax=Brassica carinata TaxID=52824 RepID=A0A8X7VS25_BRACI|nr:hypothetical protein Bca52824_019598 [Brassica carinata]
MESNSLINYPSRSDKYLGEDVKGEDNVKSEFICPFCADEFDIVGLCCHIDEDHPVEAKNGVNHLHTSHGCTPIFSRYPFEVWISLICFCFVLTIIAGVCRIVLVLLDVLGVYVQRRRRLRKGGYSSNYLTLRKELREGNLQSLGVGGSSTFVPSSNIDSDPLLSSFMFRPPLANELVIPIKEGDSVTKVSPKDTPQRLSLSNEDQEKARKSEFVGDLLWSTMLEDIF